MNKRCPECNVVYGAVHDLDCELIPMMDRVERPAPEGIPASAVHVIAPDCWCQPTLNHTDWATDGQVWVHKAPA